MKLNNKGFAITAVLYGLLILFVILVSAYLLVLSAKKDRVDNLVSDIEEEYNNSSVTEQPVNLKDYITNLYTNATKIEITNNTISYNQAQEYMLMNDRLGGTTTADGGNIRYYGSNPNNYIYFNCTDYSDTTTCEIWRIIGIVDGKVKIMRNKRLTNTSEFDNSTNKWEGSTLQTLLNSGTFYTSLQTTNVKTLELISASTWYVKGYYDAGIYANEIYKTERNGSTWTGDIAVLYPSDYGYAADLNTCKVVLSSYNNTNCTSTNWITDAVVNKGDGTAGTVWLISPYSSDSAVAWYILATGEVDDYSGVAYYRAVVPTLYLDTTLEIDPLTDGSTGNPFKLIVS